MKDLASALGNQLISGFQIGNEDVKWSILADDTVLKVEDPKDAIKKELITKSSKVADTKNTQKSIECSYSSNKLLEKLGKHFINILKIIKYHKFKQRGERQH